MQNENFYRSELENLMASFIEKHDVADDAGYLPHNIERLMADAAYTVLATVRDLNDYFEKEKPFND